MSQSLQLVPMQRSHLPGGLLLSQAAGWPHRAHDWNAIYDVSKGVVGIEDGAVVATGFCTTYGDQSRLNMIIVDERMRGRGIGKRLLAELVALAGDRPMALVATEDGFPLYRKFGFEPQGKIEQFQGTVRTVLKIDGKVRRGDVQDLGRVLDMDRAATGVDRAELLANIVRDGQLYLADGGYAVLREFGRGKVLGPVVAADLDLARTLVAAVAQGLEGTFLRIDTDPELGLVPTITSLGLQLVGDGTTMFAGPRPHSHDFTAYALASQALG
ncbi:GNAT family N-acetyltransferase [Mesorhizobium sp.]|uniref:GNAT family N-acetyltransferase n=1 Tax=Mesorhizobium sp. TaxID=1871066 RepID=UPI0025FF4F88|nr:GNAT family N-acetyltransferase [Mesorhizobium sp.]